MGSRLCPTLFRVFCLAVLVVGTAAGIKPSEGLDAVPGENQGATRLKFFPLTSHKDEQRGPTPKPSESRGYSSDENDYPVHYATYATRAGYDPTTVIAFTTFGVLGLILLLQLAGIQTLRRSFDPSPLILPFELNLKSELIPGMVSKVADWIEKFSVGGESDASSRARRSIQKDSKGKVVKEYGLLDWVVAYRKDPVEYQCVRRLACEILASSPLAANSIKTSLGDTIMSMLSRVVEDGPELVSLVEEVAGNPEKCTYLTAEEYCDDPESS